eukprot:Nitzschia sp. Nitz4//scaffold159_size51929//44888//46519//NITZ4_006886-RA/size51929-processed-gene-0.56-mRNA-1//-1//CDS//3329537595//7240//frame0
MLRGNIGKNEEDLDTFLTTIESKLRGPFSSLELANAVRTNAARGTLPPDQYLKNISQVISRTDKVIQSRMLIGMLGLDLSEETTPVIFDILQQAQEAPEEWVRATAGLIQGIMFQKTKHQQQDSDMEYGKGVVRSSRGQEATKLLKKLCEEVCSQVEETMQENHPTDADTISPDLNASFAPYHYSLVSSNYSELLFPECYGKNPHFQSLSDVDILQVDQNLEAKRAKEEQEHQGPVLMKTNLTSNASQDTAGTVPGATSNIPPGFRPTKLVDKARGGPSAAASRMFMPKKPNDALAQRQSLLQKQQLQKKALLRRKGTAQSLVNNSSMKQKVADVRSGVGAAAGAASGAASTAKGSLRAMGGAVGKFGSAGRAMAARSKMKMIDVEEVGALRSEQASREEQEANSRLSKKRRIMDAATQRGLKKTKSAGADTEGSAAQEDPGSNTGAPSASTGASAPPTNESSNWKAALQDRSNKLSPEDWQRIQQFFEQKFNPDPSQEVCKMKLHEQRSSDPATGQPIKETFYLELDYRDFSTRQSKKVKRY